MTTEPIIADIDFFLRCLGPINMNLIDKLNQNLSYFARMFYLFRFFVPLKNFSIIQRRHHSR